MWRLQKKRETLLQAFSPKSQNSWRTSYCAGSQSGDGSRWGKFSRGRLEAMESQRAWVAIDEDRWDLEVSFGYYFRNLWVCTNIKSVWYWWCCVFTFVRAWKSSTRWVQGNKSNGGKGWLIKDWIKSSQGARFSTAWKSCAKSSQGKEIERSKWWSVLRLDQFHKRWLMRRLRESFLPPI